MTIANIKFIATGRNMNAQITRNPIGQRQFLKLKSPCRAAHMVYAYVILTEYLKPIFIQILHLNQKGCHRTAKSKSIDIVKLYK